MQKRKPAKGTPSGQNIESHRRQKPAALCKQDSVHDDSEFRYPENKAAVSLSQEKHCWPGAREFQAGNSSFWGLLDTAAEGVIAVNKQGRIKMVNSAVERMFGYNRDEVLNKQLEMLLPGSLRKTHSEHRQSYFSQPQTRAMGIGMELSGRHKDGTEIPIEACLNYIKLPEGLIAVAFVSDIRIRKVAEEARCGLEAIVRCSDIAIFNKTLDGIITSWNNGAEEIYGYRAEEIIGRSAELLIPDDRSNETLKVLKRIRGGETVQEFETEHLRKDGQRICVSVRLSPLRNPKGKTEAACVIVRDITRKKRVLQKLGHLSKVFMQATDSIVIVDRNGRIIDLNDETERAYGWRRNELIGQSLDIIIAPEKRGSCPERIARCLRGEKVRNILGERLSKSGERIPVLLTSFALSNSKGEPSAVAIMAKDNRDLHQAQKDLQRNQQELRNLSAKLMNTTEEESKRVARELHDYFGPRLATLNLKVSKMGSQLTSQPDLANEIEGIRSEINEVAKLTHDLSHSLHPSLVLELGVVAALDAECATFSKLHGTNVEFSAEGVPETLSDAVSLCLYRVVQESLQNIDHHAKAQKASVKLMGNGRDVVMVIEDDGSGFDPTTARGRGGLGFVSMEERVRLVNGRLSINSNPGKGTSVKVTIPLGRV